MTGCLSLFNGCQILVLTVPIWSRPDIDFHFITPQREGGIAALPYVYKNLGQLSNGFSEMPSPWALHVKLQASACVLAEKCKAVNVLAALHNQKREKETQNATYGIFLKWDTD